MNDRSLITLSLLNGYVDVFEKDVVLNVSKEDFTLPEKELIERLDELCSSWRHHFHGNVKISSGRQKAFFPEKPGHAS